MRSLFFRERNLVQLGATVLYVMQRSSSNGKVRGCGQRVAVRCTAGLCVRSQGVRGASAAWLSMGGKGWMWVFCVCVCCFLFFFFAWLLECWARSCSIPSAVSQEGFLLLSCGLRFLHSAGANESGCERSAAGAAGTACQCEHEGKVLSPSLPKGTAARQVYGTATYPSGLHPELSPNSERCCYSSLLLFSRTGETITS